MAELDHVPVAWPGVDADAGGPAPPGGPPAPARRLGAPPALVTVGPARGGPHAGPVCDAVLAIDERGRVIEWNASAEALLGRPRAEALGRPIEELVVPPSHREAHCRAFTDCATCDRDAAYGCRMEVVALRGDGTTFPADLTITALTPPGGRRLFVAHLHDLSARRRAEQALQLSESRLQAVLDSSHAVAYLKDREGRYVLVNRRWAELFGQTKASVVGRTDAELFPAEFAAAFRENDLQALAAGRATEFEEAVPFPDGPRVYLSIKAPLCDERGRAYGTCGISTDITARKRMEEALRQSQERFRQAFDSAAVGMALVSPEGRWLRVNRALCAIVGRPEAELLETTVEAITHPEDAAFYREDAARLLAGAVDSLHREWRYLTPAGGVVCGFVSVAVVRDAGGGPLHFVCQVQDVTPRKRAEAAIAERASLAELGSEVGAILVRREALPELLGQCARALARHLDAAGVRIWTLGSGPAALELQAVAGAPDDAVEGRAVAGQIARTRSPLLADEAPAAGRAAFAGFPLLVDDRPLGVLAVRGRRPFSESALQALGAIATNLAQAIERKQSEARLAHQATHDGLTGLANRSHLLREIGRAAEAGGRCALLLVDLDRFKEINDTYGHHLGDEVLRRLRQRLLDAVRRGDLVARLGGDEFGLLLADADEAAAVDVADRILAGLAVPLFVQDRTLYVGASIGIALGPERGDDAAGLLRRADVAMYAAKRAHAGRVVYDPELSRVAAERMELMADLQRGIAAGQLYLLYQPKVDLATGRPVGAEALLRWRHPRLGLVPPSRFIPLAEDAGVIRPVARWALRHALLQARAWHDAGHDVNVAVNLSPENLQDDGLARQVRELLDGTGADPCRLTLEVTETAMMKQPAATRAALEGLHALGVRIAIDDFGTGYSSLAYLKALPVDEVKIDRSFVGDMLADPRDSCIVRAVIDLGHNLGLKVVAEGVETREAAEALAAWGCDAAQGYLFAHPLPPAEAVAWIAGRA
jgi:diguanylate cyclase (GGDEF)-like protein/PAS domain S-box-containing protein